MHFYRFPLTFRKGSSVLPLCVGAQETAYTLSFGANGLLEGPRTGVEHVKALY